MNFGSGTSASFGAGVTVEQTSTLSATELASTVVIADDATLRCSRRDGDEPLRGKRHLAGRVPGHSLPPPSLSLRFEGKLRDRVGKGNGLTARDGALDATFRVTVEAGSGARTVTQLELWRLIGSGRWDTIPSTPQWWSAPPEGSTARSTTPANGSRQLRHR